MDTMAREIADSIPCSDSELLSPSNLMVMGHCLVLQMRSLCPLPPHRKIKKKGPVCYRHPTSAENRCCVPHFHHALKKKKYKNHQYLEVITRLGGAAVSQLAFLGENDPTFFW